MTSDEEVSNTLSGQEGIDIIMDIARKSCAVFDLEPGNTRGITVGRKGILRMSVEVIGVAAHSGNAYFDGASAIKEAANMILEIEKMSKKDGITFNCGVIEGGTAPNIVPDRCVVEIDIRASEPEEMKVAENLIYDISQKSATPNTKRSAKRISVRPPMKITDGNVHLLNLWNACAKTLGIEEFKGIQKGGGSDAAYTVLAGVPTLCSCGMVGYNEHTTDEKVDLSTFDERVVLICNTIKKL